MARNHFLLVDNDVSLVRQMRCALQDEAPGVEILGPPQLLLEVEDIKSNLRGARLLILDLNIGGSPCAGTTFLSKLRRTLQANDTPVIVWSKYLFGTTVFTVAGRLRWSAGGFTAVSEEDDTANADRVVISDLYKVYGGVYAIVSKTVTASPVTHLLDAFRIMGVL